MNLRKIAKKVPLLRLAVIFARRRIKPNRSDLLRRLQKNQKNCLKDILQSLSETHQMPSFVKVGANDGITGDPCGDIFLRNQNWKGLLIEPVEYCAEKLKAVYSDTSRFTVAQIAIGSKNEQRPFYYLAAEAKESIPELPLWYDQLGSFERSHIVKHFKYDVERFITEKVIEVAPLSSVLKRYSFSTPTFLHIDTEGFDFEVMKSIDFSASSPEAILAEHRHLNASDLSSMIKLLKKNGYLIWDTGADLLALSTCTNRVAGRVEPPSPHTTGHTGPYHGGS